MTPVSDSQEGRSYSGLSLDKQQLPAPGIESSPESRVGSMGPSGLSVMLRSAATSPDRRRRESTPSEPASQSVTPKAEKKTQLGHSVTDIQAPGANGLAGVIDINRSQPKRDPEGLKPDRDSGSQDPSPVSSAGTARPGAYKPVSSFSSSLNTIKGNSDLPKSLTPNGSAVALREEEADVKVGERTPLLSTIRETPAVGQGSKKPDSQGYEQAEPRQDRTGLLSGIASLRQDMSAAVNNAASSARKASVKDIFQAVVVAPAECIPAVVLGLLLNVLDGVSYGMIT